MVALKHYKEHVKAAVAAGADVIISGAGLPMDLPALIGEHAAQKLPQSYLQTCCKPYSQNVGTQI